MTALPLAAEPSVRCRPPACKRDEVHRDSAPESAERPGGCPRGRVPSSSCVTQLVTQAGQAGRQAASRSCSQDSPDSLTTRLIPGRGRCQSGEILRPIGPALLTTRPLHVGRDPARSPTRNHSARSSARKGNSCRTLPGMSAPISPPNTRASATGSSPLRPGPQPAATVAPEAPAVVLGAETFEDDEFGGTWASPGKGNASFDTAVRALLGVTDQRRKGDVVHARRRLRQYLHPGVLGAGQRVLRGAERRLPRPV